MQTQSTGDSKPIGNLELTVGEAKFLWEVLEHVNPAGIPALEIKLILLKKLLPMTGGRVGRTS